MGNFAERLKSLRKEHHRTIKEMAEYLEVSIRAYSYYESGTNYPNTPGLLKLADYFGVSTDYLLGRTDARCTAEDAGGQSTFSLTDAARYGIMSRSGKRGAAEREQMDRAFSGFLRLLIARLKALSEEKDPRKKDALLQEILTDLQDTLED